MDDKEFIDLVNREMDDIGKIHNQLKKGSLFAIWFMNKVLAEELGTAVNTYHIGDGDLKADIGICDDDHETTIVGQSKFSEDPLHSNFNEDLIDELLTGVRNLKSRPNEGNHRRQEFAKDFNLQKKPLQMLAVAFSKVTPKAFAYAIKNDVEVYDFDEIKKRYILFNLPERMRVPRVVTLSIRDGRIAKQRERGFELLSFLTDVKDIYEALDRYKDGLFQENLRFRLPEKKRSIGNDIKQTVEDHPEHLAILNNGLTIVCRKAIFRGRTKIELVKPQVVNGGQTCWAVHIACAERHKAGLLKKLKASLAVRVVETSDARLAKHIAKCTNTQNPISQRDMKSLERHQREIGAAFAKIEPKVLYEYRAGQLQVAKRAKQDTVYKVIGTRSRYRILVNERAGQLYLAMLGKPYLCKSSKKKIFEHEEFYKTIFEYETSKEVRFTNQEIGIAPRDVNLRTGSVDYFVEDITFGLGLYELTDAVRKVYQDKYELFESHYGQDEKKPNVYFDLAEKEDFLDKWHYYVVAAMNYIVEKFARGDKSKRIVLREKLVGNDVNRFWDPGLSADFNINQDLERFVVLDENNPSANFKLFSKWILSLTQMMYELVKAEMEKGNWKSMRNFLELNQDTYPNLTRRIDQIWGGIASVRDSFFPESM